MDIHRSARKHRVADDDVLHAVDRALVIADLDPNSDPPKVMFIGPDRAGRRLEVIALTLAGDRVMAIHAMPLRAAFHDLLPSPDDPDA